MVETDTARFHILDQNSLVLPGKCVGCGTTQGTFLDLGLELDFYGVVYFCIDNCLVEIVNAMDYHTPKQWMLVTESNSVLREENNKLKDENEELRNAVGSLSRLNNGVNVVSVDGLPMDEEPKLLKSDPPDSSESESRPSEQTNEQRSADILSDDSVDEFLGLGETI